MTVQPVAELRSQGRFGVYGGQYVPETLIPVLDELEAAYAAAARDPAFAIEVDRYLSTYCGRPTPLYAARRLTEALGGARIYLKREDLLHTGAHKINNTIGQVLLAVRMGKRRIIAETGAGQHGVATASVAAAFGLPCDVYMGTEDMERQALNVFRMELLGARVVPVDSGTRTLKDAINEALRDWVTNVRTTLYVIGSVVGPHPYPLLVRDFQSVIGREAREQVLAAEERLPDCVIACVGGGSNSMGLFYPFKDDAAVEMVGVEAGGLGLDTGQHAATLCAGSPGVLHGTMTYRCRAPTARCCPPTPSPRDWTIPASVPSTRIFGTPGGPAMCPQPTARRSRDFTCSAAQRESSPRSSPPTPWRTCERWRRNWVLTRSSCLG